MVVASEGEREGRGKGGRETIQEDESTQLKEVIILA